MSLETSDTDIESEDDSQDMGVTQEGSLPNCILRSLVEQGQIERKNDDWYVVHTDDGEAFYVSATAVDAVVDGVCKNICD